MKSVLMLLLALVLVLVVWSVVRSLIAGILALIFHVAMLGIFCYVVYLVYRAMTQRQRI